ncbi:MAG: ABC transporter substrate-binding protein [Desulfomonile tiedjei]|nr:ABC transporter substrate-binding protein [Desulfomonile tiedjei]
MTARNMALVLALVVLLVPGICFSADVPGVTDKEVVIGVTTPVSGPAALWGVTAVGMKAWAEHVNAQGGVHGRKIKVLIQDDAYNPTRALANLQEMKGNVFAVSGLLGTAILNASKDFFPDNKVPLVTPYGDVRIWTKQPKDKLTYVFVAYPDYEDEAEYITKYAVNKLNAKKIALFYQNDDYGKMAMSGVKKALGELGDKAKLVEAVPYEVTDRALNTHALKLKESGADTLIIYTTPTHGALITKETAKIDYRPNRLTTFTLGDPIMFKLAGEPWEGTYVALPGNSGVPGSDPPADKVVSVLSNLDPSIKGKEYLALFGAMSMIHVVEGLKNAGRDLTPEAFVKGMEKIKDWKPEGIGAPVTYLPDRHHGVNASRMGVAKEGKVVPLEEFTMFKPHF